MTSKTPGRTFYDDQVAFLVAHDIDGIMSHYTEDAEIVSFDFTRKGHAEIRPHFEGYLKMLGNLKLLSTDKFTETDDSIFFEATVQADIGIAKVYDAFVLKGGKATHHFTGVISVTPA
jgi:hypothetical protein